MPWGTVLLQELQKARDQDVARQQAAASAFVPQLEVLSSGSNDFVFLPDPGFQREKMSRCERLLLVGGLIFFHEMARFPGQYIDESRLAITPS